MEKKRYTIPLSIDLKNHESQHISSRRSLSKNGSGFWLIQIQSKQSIVFFLTYKIMSLYQKYLATIKKWLWLKADYDGYYANQCVDWAKMYARDIWYPITTSGNAKEFATKWLWKNWVKVAWEAWVWDIVIFHTGTYWHIAVVHKIEWKNMLVVEQNRDWMAYKNNNSKNFWSPVSYWKYILKGNEVFFRVR